MPQKKSESVDVVQVNLGSVTIAVKGESPLIMNRLASKAEQQLLLPPQRKNNAAKASTLKHNPLEEFRASPHIIYDDSAPTLLAMPSTAFKGAMRTAALDLPGVSKAQIGRLTYIPGEYVPIYGIPYVKCDVVRNSDINHTPDVRTRVIIPEWTALVTINFVTPIIKPESVVNLIAAAGVTAGIGDFRPEKGAGSFGRFSPVSQDDPDFLEITSTAGREAQEMAMAAADTYDEPTRELLEWFKVEARRRGFEVAA